MSDYRRARVPGGTYFFTVAIAERSRSTLTDHVDALRNAVRTACGARPFLIDAIMVLPGHLHCLWTLPPGDVDYPVRWAHLKAVFSRTMPRDERRHASRVLKRERGVWQRRYWEHAIKDDNDFRNHVDYIHYNPVKHGYVETPIDWPYSSLHRFVMSGALPANCAGPVRTIVAG